MLTELFKFVFEAIKICDNAFEEPKPKDTRPDPYQLLQELNGVKMFNKNPPEYKAFISSLNRWTHSCYP